MKKNLVLTALILLVLCLTGCSSVFDAAISGTVKDRSTANNSTTSTNVGVIGDAMVYAYDSESAWNNAYNSWVSSGKGEFVDNSVPSAKTSTADGSFSIATLRWKTLNPAYGKDADSKTVYLLVFHKDYGLTKVSGRTVQSDKSNNFGVVYLDKITTNKNLVIKFKDKDDNSTTATGSDSTITSTSGFSFRYKYNDGYGDITGTVSSITNGSYTLNVCYKDETTPPEVTIYDIQGDSDWSYEGSDVVMTYNTTSKSYDNTSLYFTNDWKSVAVTIKLKDGSSVNQDTNVADSIDFKWSYNDGDNDNSKTVSVSGGSTTVNVKYKKGQNCELKLEGFSCTEKEAKDYWDWTKSAKDGTVNGDGASETIKLDGSKDSVTYNVYFKKKVLVVPSSGFYGYLVDQITPTVSTNGGGYGASTDNGIPVAIYNGDTKLGSDVYTSPNNVTSSGNVVTYNGQFKGVAAGQRIKLTYTNANSYISDNVDLKLQHANRGEATSSSSTPAKTFTVNSTTDSFDLSLIEY